MFDCGNCDCDPDGYMPFAAWEISGLGEFTQCPKRQVTEKSQYYLRLYQHYRNNLLATSGGVLDQPHVYLEAMELIDARVQQWRARQKRDST